MKKILSFLLVFLGLTIAKAQPPSYKGFVTTQAVNVDSSWVVYETNTPGSTFGNRIDWIHINRRRISFRNKRIFMDTISKREFTWANDAKLMWLDPTTREMSVTTVTNIPITSFSGYTAATNYVAGSNISISGPTISASFTESDPIFSASPSYSITNTNISNWNTAYSWGNHTGLYYPLTGNPSGFLTSEVDGSITNELQTLSQSGNTITLSNSGGSFVLPTTTAPTSITVQGAITATQSGQSFTLSAPVQTVMTTYTVSRTVNSDTFIPSSTKPFSVDYTIDIQTSVALLTGASSGTVFLEYSTDGGSTWNEMDRGQNNQSLGVAISVSLTSINTVKVTGWFDANTIIRLRNATGGTGTATFTYVRGKERY